MTGDEAGVSGGARLRPGRNARDALRDRAREMRAAPTPGEEALWRALRRDALDGRHFRRQRVIGPFIVDFFCPAEKLVVEVDGPIHESQRDRDAERDALLTATGLRVLRIDTALAEQNMAAVLDLIRAALSEQTPDSRRSTDTPRNADARSSLSPPRGGKGDEG